MITPKVLVILGLSVLGAAADSEVGHGFVRFPVAAVLTASGSAESKRQIPVGVASLEDHTAYAVDLTIGTPGQRITVLLDTGSDELWVKPNCNNAVDKVFCTSEPQFVDGKSSTQVNLGTTSFIPYGTGNVTLKYVKDVVLVGCASSILYFRYVITHLTLY
jgi:Eukaryotic aspartyl protease